MNGKRIWEYLSGRDCFNAHRQVYMIGMQPPKLRLSLLFLLLACAVFLAGSVRADDDEGAGGPGSTNGPAAGHSLHGEAFDEGPRQAAVLMEGTGKVEFPVSSKHPKAQAFFNQGVGQLYGFWYFEAERSFRQVAAYDTNCALAYWGMALANVNNSKRAQGFIKQAHDLKTNATPRETLWIEAYHAYFTGKSGETERRKDLVLALEKIIQKYPKDIEAKAFLAFQIWENETKGIAVTSRQSIDSLVNEVLAKEPLHPVHHARIHLWNDKQDERALNSAARCGQSAPGIAHMWHMPGHTYSQLKRYDDAAWQQEAAARTDHAYMTAARILPDQIHNFAHNNQWLCTDLLYCGRVRDAIELARNMVELPRHPKYNTLNRKEDNTAYDKNNGSSMLGRNRLFDAFLGYELWPQLLALADTFYLEPTDLPEEQARRFYALALAHFGLGDTNDISRLQASLEDCSKQLKRERFEAAEKAEEGARKDKSDTSQAMVKAMKGFDSRLDRVDKYRRELKIWSAIAEGNTNQARTLLTDDSELPKEQRARLWHALGDNDQTVKLAKELVKGSTNQAPSLALAAYLYWTASETNAAVKTFKQLRSISSRFDLDTPLFARLDPLAHHLKLPGDWRLDAPRKKNVGKRPALDSLGPFRWQPYNAPSWTLKDEDSTEMSLADFKGHPVLVVFYLGAGCPHCIEQLNLLAPVAKDFKAQGVSIVAVSTESEEGLHKTAQKAKLTEGFPFPLLSDASLKTFKAYRAYDDFEHMPLHGTFLVDGAGKVRWQDISYEPFADMKFLLSESHRLLGLSQPQFAGSAKR
jgi:peroxiredoxin